MDYYKAERKEKGVRQHDAGEEDGVVGCRSVLGTAAALHHDSAPCEFIL